MTKPPPCAHKEQSEIKPGDLVIVKHDIWIHRHNKILKVGTPIIIKAIHEIYESTKFFIVNLLTHIHDEFFMSKDSQFYYFEKISE